MRVQGCKSCRESRGQRPFAGCGAAPHCFLFLFNPEGNLLWNRNKIKKLKKIAKEIAVLFSCAATVWLGGVVTVEAKDKIIYVPIDNRPVNMEQVMDVAQRAGYDIVVPPLEIVGSWNQYGDPERMWDWVRQEAPTAKAAVLSTDSLLYGSLVGSRLSEETTDTIMERARKFEQLRKDFPRLPIYALGTIRRTPSYNVSDGVEPTYYGTYGARIFRYTALKDKESMGLASGRELREMKKLEADIPAEYLDDWFAKRERNYRANQYFVDLTWQGAFNYFLLGCDDSAPFSRTHMESRYLAERGKDIGKTKFIVASGADELGMLMVARAINDMRRDIPLVYVEYNEGKGSETIPSYSNDNIKDDVDAAITAMGGIVTNAPERAELVVAVHTNHNGTTMEASSPKNTKRLRGSVKHFTETVKDMLNKGYPVGVADIATSNGSDNSLMEQLRKDDLLFKLRAYGGWNTATNTTGFLIGSGVLTRFMEQDDIYALLMTRYLDDWVYQANDRQILASMLPELPGEMDANRLGGKWGAANLANNELARQFMQENLRLPEGYVYRHLKMWLPWNRLFECNPQVTLYTEAELARIKAME